jgi:toxin ParE1/3/4
MSLPVQRSPFFEEDFCAHYEWYLERAGEGVADQLVECVDQTLEDLSLHPGLGRRRRFRHPDLAGIRSFGVVPPFRALIVFYRFTERELIVERLMHGSRDLPRRLLEPPGLD